MAYILLEISSLILRLLQDIFEAVKGVMIYAKISTDDSRAMLLMKQLDLGRNSRHDIRRESHQGVQQAHEL